MCAGILAFVVWFREIESKLMFSNHITTQQTLTLSHTHIIYSIQSLFLNLIIIITMIIIY